MKGKQTPKCTAHIDCFANHGGVCCCLNDNDFNGKDCPFYKTKETVRKEQDGGLDYGYQ